MKLIAVVATTLVSQISADVLGLKTFSGNRTARGNKRPTGSNERAFSGQVASFLEPINGYGCWCYLDDTYRELAHARPVDTLDDTCRELINGYKCATMDAEDASEVECDAQQIVYSQFNFFGREEEHLEEDCASLNPLDVCAQRACMIEALFVFHIGTHLFFSGVDTRADYDPNMVHISKGGPFDPAVECVGINNPVRSQSECCGSYGIGRKPYRVDSGFTSRSCCANEVYNKLIHECCGSTDVVLIGSC